MTNLLARHVGELIAELEPLLAGLEVRDLAPFPPRDLVLVLEPREPDGPVPRLRLSADADVPRLHLQHGRTRAHGGPVGPFFQRAIDELTGAELRRLEQVRGDRLVLLEFHRTPSGKRRALVLELVGRHANLVLLGADDEVLEVLVPPPRRGRSAPRLTRGEPWSPPGGGARPPAVDEPSLADSLPAPDEDPPPGLADRAPLSWRVERALGGEATEHRRARLAKDLADRLKRRLSRARGLVRGLERRATATDDADRVRRDGELLKASMNRLARGMESVEVPDWYEEDAPPRRLELDPRRTPQQNVERYFERAAKLERSRETVAEELGRAREKVAGLEELLAAARAEDADPEALEARALERKLLEPRQQGDPRKRKPPAPRLPYRSFVVSGGHEVRVGRSARDNDTLTIRHARGNDLWLHTADRPGSHVILRVEKGREPDPEAVIDAALLAVHFSPARGGDGVPVHVAHQKEVHKPRGAKPGLVTLSGGRILRVRAQQERLEALLRAARDRPGTS